MVRGHCAALALSVLLCGTAFGGDLFPFSMPWNDTGNRGITDLTAWNDAPAGAHGFVTVADGHLVADGKRLKMLGVNIVFGSNFPTHDEADIAAKRMARFGINIVRLHHMDTTAAPNGLLQKDRRTLDPVMLDRMDYFIAALKRAGIYTDLNLHVGRSYPGMGKVWEGGTEYWKGVDHFYPEMIRLQKEFARDLLAHRNPYTSTTYAEEPAIALVEINNENGLIREWGDGALDGMTEPYRAELTRQWNLWLKQHYGSEKALRAAWGSQDEKLGGEMLGQGISPAWGKPGWQLQTIGSAKARVTPSKDGLVLTLDAKGQESWHTQLHQSGLRFTADRPYTLTMTLRADHPMSVAVTAMANHAPWTRLWADKIKLTTEWKTVSLTFAPAVSETEARLSLGELSFETGQVEIGAVSLKPGGVAGFRPGESLDRGTVAITDYTTRASRTLAAQRDWLNFLWDTEDGYWREMQRFLKADLKVRPLIVGTQVSYSPGAIQSAMDVVDGHSYWQHPQFPGKAWDRDNWLIKNTPMAGIEGGGTIAELALRRIAGKPFVVTEYNTPAPSLYQGETMPLITAYGGMQDWDAIFLFCYGSWNGDWQVDSISDFFDSRANPVKMASLIASAALLRRGDVKASANKNSAVPERSAWIEALRRSPHMPGADSFGAPRDAALAGSASVATGAGPAPSWPIVSDTGELTWGLDGIGGKTVVVDSPRAKALVGARLGKSYDAHGVGLELTAARKDWGVLLANAIDGKDFSSPGHILITALGEEENTGQQWRDAQKTTVGRQFGKAPVLVEGLGAKISLPVPAARVSAWALDEKGARKQALKVSGTARAEIAVGEAYRTLWYEVEIH